MVGVGPGVLEAKGVWVEPKESKLQPRMAAASPSPRKRREKRFMIFLILVIKEGVKQAFIRVA